MRAGAAAAKKRNRVFICYRNEDSGPVAELLSEHLKSYFGSDRIFYAPNQTQPGSDFPDVLQEQLEKAAVIIAVIGRHWLGAKDEYERRRLDLENDWVRKELSYGLSKKEVTLIPFLIDDVEMLSPNEAAVALPADLQSLANKQAIQAPKTRDLPRALVETVAEALKIEVALIDALRHSAANSRFETVVVVLRAGKAVTNDNVAQHSPSESESHLLIEALQDRFPGKVSVHSPGALGSTELVLSESELLTCNAAVLLVDRDSFGSAFFRRRVDVLAWRSALGMPLVCILLDGLRRQDLKRSPFSFLAELTVLTEFKIDGTRVRQKTKLVEVAIETLASEMAARKHSLYSDPATKWASEVGDILSALPERSLPALGEMLGIQGAVLERASNCRDLIAATLFVAELEDAYRFLRNVVRLLDQLGVSSACTEGLIQRVQPIWVDLNTGRQILNASQLPPKRRLCGLRLNQLEWAEHATKRASASDPEYPFTKLTSVAGEYADKELILRHKKTLQQSLGFFDNNSPGFIEERLRRLNKAVFAILDCKGLSSRQVRGVVRALADGFPGITFLLVDDRDSQTWKFHPPVRFASDSLDEDNQQRIAHYLNRTSALISRKSN